MNKSVTGNDVGHGDIGTVDHNAVSHSEGERLSIRRISHHTFGDCRGRNLRRDNVVEKDVGKRCFTFRRVECCQVDTSIDERLVCWCEDGERPWTLESREEIGLNDGIDQRVVNGGALSGCWDVDGRHQDGIDNVNDSV